MNRTVTYKKHFVAVASLFILGDALIGMPYKSADDKTLIGFAIAAVITILLYLAIVPVVGGFIRNKISNNSGIIVKIFGALLFTAICLYALWIGSLNMKHFIRFVKVDLLQNTADFYIALVMVIVIAALAGKKKEIFLKFSLISFWLTTAIILVFMAFSADQFDFRNILVFKVPSFKEIFNQTMSYLPNLVFPSLLIPIYQAVVLKRAKLGESMLGLGVGLVLLNFCIVNSVLIFGPQFAAKLDYPYAYAISTVTIGRIFKRMDSFAYLIYYLTSAARMTMCVDIVIRLLKKTNQLFPKKSGRPAKSRGKIKARGYVVE